MFIIWWMPYARHTVITMEYADWQEFSDCIIYQMKLYYPHSICVFLQWYFLFMSLYTKTDGKCTRVWQFVNRMIMPMINMHAYLLSVSIVMKVVLFMNNVLWLGMCNAAFRVIRFISRCIITNPFCWTTCSVLTSYKIILNTSYVN